MQDAGHEGRALVADGVVRLTPGDLSVTPGDGEGSPERRLVERSVLVLVGLTGTGKTTAADRLLESLPGTVVLPDRRALTDQLILPMMTGDDRPVDDRLERFRLTAAFKERHPGGMGDVLAWLVLPEGLAERPVLFDGLRGQAEVAAAAASLPQARFAVLDCPPEHRLLRLCGRHDPFDRVASVARPAALASQPGAAATRTVLAATGFDTLVDTETVDRVAVTLAEAGGDPSDTARCAAIIVEESRHYDPAKARDALLRLAPTRTLALNTAQHAPEEVAAAIARWWVDGASR